MEGFLSMVCLRTTASINFFFFFLLDGFRKAEVFTVKTEPEQHLVT